MKTNHLKIALTLGCLILCAAVFDPFAVLGQQGPQPAAALPAPQKPKDYERFTHQSHLGTVNVPGTNHARILKCETCHERRDLMKNVVPTTDRNKQLQLKFPGHKSCVECHVQQFTSRPPQTCTICHDTKQGLIARPPQRDFPQRYDFNAFFDAKEHEKHVSYPLPDGKKTDCTFCHKQEARPAPLGIASHPECFVCHAPTSADKKASVKSDCKICHTEQTTAVTRFSTLYASFAYDAHFTHKTHVQYTKGSCSECHTVNAGYNQPTPTSLKIDGHRNVPSDRTGRGCFSCHDGGVHLGRKVFGSEPGQEGGGSCTKCHDRDDGKLKKSLGPN